MAFTYIVRCSDDTYYVGSTKDLALRLWQHNHSDDGAAYTRKRRPVTLVWSAEFESIADAFAYEKRVQGWRREKREAHIRGDFGVLPALASRSHANRGDRRSRDGP
jgi:putative endonuclease